MFGKWSLINTAPFDGTAVLLHNNYPPGLSNERPDKCYGGNTVVGEWWESEDKFEDGEWVCYMDLVLDPRCPFEPTHWMPLPEIP